MNVPNILVIALAIFLVIKCSGKTENFVEVFGFAGMGKKQETLSGVTKLDYDMTKFTKQEKYEVTPDTVKSILDVSRKYLSTKYDMCAQPLATNYINKYTDGTRTIYKGSFIFMKVGGFPYGFSAIVDVLMDPVPTLLKLDVQETTNSDLETIKPFVHERVTDNFTGFDAIVQANNPVIQK